MKRTLITVFFILMLASALGLTLFTRAKKANAEVAAGNQAYAAQDYEIALQHYTKAQSQVPGQAEPLYNAANVFYQQQALDQAQQFLEQALAQPQKTVEALIHFNLGNVAFLAKQFDAAVTQYESALRIDPVDQAAKYNLELALLQQQNQQDQQDQQQDQQEQQQDQQQDQQNQQDQQGQQQDQQNQQDQQGQQQDQQNQQDQQGQQQNQQGQDQQQGQQPGQEQQQGQQQDQQGQGQQGQQDQQPGQQGQQDQDQQQGQQGQQDQDQQQGQQQDQQGQGQQGQQSQQPGQQGQQPGQPTGQVAGMQPQQGLTAQQAWQLLAAIAGNSQTLMQQMQLYYYVPGATPEKDW